MEQSKIVKLYESMLRLHASICYGGSEQCKMNSLECLVDVFERNQEILSKFYSYPIY